MHLPFHACEIHDDTVTHFMRKIAIRSKVIQKWRLLLEILPMTQLRYALIGRGRHRIGVVCYGVRAGECVYERKSTIRISSPLRICIRATHRTNFSDSWSQENSYSVKFCSSSQFVVSGWSERCSAAYEMLCATVKLSSRGFPSKSFRCSLFQPLLWQWPSLASWGL